MAKRQPGRDKATTYLRLLLERFEREGGMRLPSLGRMARAADVSRATMVKSVTDLKRQGLLEGRSRSGIFRAGVVRPSAAENADNRQVDGRAARAEQVLQAIGGDISDGHFALGASLPSYKELVQRYGTSYRALRRLLDTLVKQHVLERYRRGYRLVEAVRAPCVGTVVLVCAGEEGGRPAHWTARSEEGMHAFERECAVARQSHLTVTCHFLSGRLFKLGGRPVTVADLVRIRGGLGFVVFYSGTSYDTVSKLVTRAGEAGLPIAILDEFGGACPFRPSSTLRLFTTAASTSAGRTVGTYLRNTGHRRIAFVSAVHDAPWSQNRLTGLREAFAPGRGDRAVVEVTENRFGELAGAHDRTVRGIAAIQQYLALDAKREHEGQNLLRRVVADLTPHLQTALNRLSGSEVLQPMFEQALGHRDVTAWVCVNDTAGLEALTFLNERSTRVPEDTAIVGFDDTVGAADAGLTSYNFNMSGVVHAMVAHALAPDKSRPAATDRLFTEIEGYLTVRRSTSPR